MIPPRFIFNNIVPPRRIMPGVGMGRPGGFREPGPRRAFKDAIVRPAALPPEYRKGPHRVVPPAPSPPPPPPATLTAQPHRLVIPPPPSSGPLKSPDVTPYTIPLSNAARALQLDVKTVVAHICRGLPESGLAEQVMMAAATGNVKALGQLLSRAEVLPDFTSASGLTPLMVAAARGHTDAVEMLSRHPLVDVGRTGPDGWTALHFASALQNGAAAASLLTHYAPPDTKNADGLTPVDLASTAVEDAFWQNRNFRRHMETVNRGHPRLLGGRTAQPKPPRP